MGNNPRPDIFIKDKNSRQQVNKDVQQRFKELVEREFRDRASALVKQIERTADEEQRPELKRKIAEASRRVLQYNEIWRQFASWE